MASSGSGSLAELSTILESATISDIPTPEGGYYVYSALQHDQFRVLTLLPGNLDSPISVTLHHRNLQGSKNSYEALSYVWGDADNRRTILCDGVELKITANLHVALRYLRTSKPRVMWIDAICINQDDIPERNQQVSLMKSIYPDASQVVVWLGESSWDSDLSISTMLKWSATWNRLQELEISLFQQRKLFRDEYCFRTDYSQKHAAIRNFMSRSWFSRCWTFQEIVLSSRATVMCGATTLSWESLEGILEMLGMAIEDSRLLHMNALIMDVFYQTRKKGGQGPTLSNLLGSRYLSLESSDPRDIIFSLLSLAHLNDPRLFTPTYQMSICDTYTLFTASMIHDEDSLSIFSHVEREFPDPALPSWVPDWRVPSIGLTLGDIGLYKFDIHGMLRPTLHVGTLSGGRLITRGAQIDIVGHVYSLSKLRKDTKTARSAQGLGNLISEFATECNLDTFYQAGDHPIAKVLLRTLTADGGHMSPRLDDDIQAHLFPYHRQMSSSALRDLYAQIYSPGNRSSSEAQNRKQEDEIATEGLTLKSVKEIVGRINSRSEYHLLFITKRGYVGLGTKRMQRDDVVCSFFGASVPFILRPVEGTRYFKLLGEAYIDGIMDGQLFRKKSGRDGGIEPAVEWVEMRNFTLV